jgi:cytochrome c oxidase cbb3-type subunit 4
MDSVDFHSVLTVVFFIAFIALVVWVYLPGRKAKHERDAQLPFVGEDAPGRKERKDNE